MPEYLQVTYQTSGGGGRGGGGGGHRFNSYLIPVVNSMILMKPLVQKGIFEKWDLRPGTAGGTRDMRPGTHLIRGTRDPRPRTLKVGPEIRDPRP